MTPLEVSNNDHCTLNPDGESSQVELDCGMVDEDAEGSGCENTEVDNASSDVEQYQSEGPECKDSSVLTEANGLSEDTRVSDKQCLTHSS